MPYSSVYGKKIILRWLSESRPDIKTMVDFGAGAGYYGKLFKRLLPACRREAVEAYLPYLEKFNLWRLYHMIYVEDASKMALPDADIAIFGDVVEHMTKEVALDFLWRIEAKYKHVIISIPFGSYPQGAVGGNEYERHLSEWGYEELLRLFKNYKIQTTDENIAVFIKQE